MKERKNGEVLRERVASLVRKRESDRRKVGRRDGEGGERERERAEENERSAA